MTISAGELDRRITIEQPDTTRDATYGSVTVGWTTFATVWAQIRESASAGDELMKSGAFAGARPSRVRMYYLAGVTTAMRINHGGRYLQILGVAELGRKQGLELACKEWSHE